MVSASSGDVTDGAGFTQRIVGRIWCAVGNNVTGGCPAIVSVAV